MNEFHNLTRPPGALPEGNGNLPLGNTTRLIGGSYIGMIVVATSLNAIPVCLTAIGATFGLSKTQLGLVAAAMFVGRVPAILCAGPLADRFGLKPLLLIGAVGVIVGLVLMGLAPTYFLLLGACLIAGAFSGPFDVLLDPLVCALRPARKASALNFLHAFYPVGAVGAVAVTTAILGGIGTWRVVFPLMTLPAVAYLLCVASCEFPQIQRQAGRTAAVELLSNPLLIVIVLMMIIAACTELGPAQWLPAYMEQVFQWPRSASASILLAFNVLMAAGRFGVSGLARHLKPMLLLLVAATLCIICLLVGALAASGWTAAAALALLGATVACMWPSTVAYAAERFPAGGATMFSVLVTAGNIGGIVGPATIGALGDYVGLRWGMGTVACLPLVAALLFLWRLRADRPGPATSGT